MKTAPLAWSIDDIPFATLDRERVSNDDYLLYTVACASFVEITSDLYTRNLIEYFRADSDVVAWLGDQWEPEEMQHGHALRRYVETAWPDFDWETAYRVFYEDYEKYCKVELLGPTPALEMAARCVVETGTATFYRMLAETAAEPTLRALTANISRDEVGHYKHFYSFFRDYRDQERTSRAEIVRTLWRRIREVDAEDMFSAVKGVHAVLHPGQPLDLKGYEAYRRYRERFMRAHFPFEMGVRMVLKPLDLGPITNKLVEPALIALARAAV
jgi:rubrerythrin